MITKFLSIIIFSIVRLLSLTYRFRFQNNDKLKSLADKKQNFVFAIWHQHLFGGILAQTGLSHIVIVSKSKDAEPVAFTCKQFGHIVARGSSRKGSVDKGGSLAKDEMVKFLKLGHPGAITVDGPKGPALKVKPGIIAIAKESQAAIVPYAVCSNSFWQFNSWDQFRLPKPFAKILVSYGDPIYVPADARSFDTYQEILEKSLNELKINTENSVANWDQYSKTNWYK